MSQLIFTRRQMAKCWVSTRILDRYNNIDRNTLSFRCSLFEQHILIQICNYNFHSALYPKKPWYVRSIAGLKPIKTSIWTVPENWIRFYSILTTTRISHVGLSSFSWVVCSKIGNIAGAIIVLPNASQGTCISQDLEDSEWSPVPNYWADEPFEPKSF